MSILAGNLLQLDWSIALLKAKAAAIIISLRTIVTLAGVLTESILFNVRRIYILSDDFYFSIV